LATTIDSEQGSISRCLGGCSGFVCIPTIQAGDATFTSIPIRLQPDNSATLFADTGFGGLLGTDILRQLIVTLDLAHGRMYRTNHPDRPEDRYLFSMIGYPFAKDANGYFTILAVSDPSPAAQARLKIGDRVLAINRHVTGTMSLDDFTREIHGESAAAVHLVVDSDGQQLAVKVQTTSFCAGHFAQCAVLSCKPTGYIPFKENQGLTSSRNAVSTKKEECSRLSRVGR
jgi:hypothetical protein